jgi:hypothetical protein
VGHWVSIYGSEALYRGRDWGLRVIQHVAPAARVAWPSYARLRARAEALVVELAGGDQGVLAVLARRCADAAGDVYEALREMGSTGATLLPANPAPVDADAPRRPGPTASTGPCPGCRERAVRCDACVRAWAAVHTKNATTWGRQWGASATPPKLPYDASLETRAAAQRRIRSLAGSDARTIDSLARICAEAAWAAAGEGADPAPSSPPAT